MCSSSIFRMRSKNKKKIHKKYKHSVKELPEEHSNIGYIIRYKFLLYFTTEDEFFFSFFHSLIKGDMKI